MVSNNTAGVSCGGGDAHSLVRIQRIDHCPQPDSTELTIRRKRKREDASESELRTEFPSTEARTQLAINLDTAARKLQIRLAHALFCAVFVISDYSITLPGFKMRDSLPVKADVFPKPPAPRRYPGPAPSPASVTLVSGDGGSLLAGIPRGEPCRPTYSYLTLPTTMTSRQNMLIP